MHHSQTRCVILVQGTPLLIVMMCSEVLVWCWLQGCATNDHDAPLEHHDALLGGLMHHICSWYTIVALDAPFMLWGMVWCLRWSNDAHKLKMLKEDTPNVMMCHHDGGCFIMMFHGDLDVPLEHHDVSWWLMMLHHLCLLMLMQFLSNMRVLEAAAWQTVNHMYH